MATNMSEALDVVGPKNLRLACQQMAETIRGQLRCRARASRCITVGACRRSGRISWFGEWRAARLEFQYESDGPSSRSDVESKHSGYAMWYAARVSYRFL